MEDALDTYTPYDPATTVLDVRAFLHHVTQQQKILRRSYDEIAVGRIKLDELIHFYRYSEMALYFEVEAKETGSENGKPYTFDIPSWTRSILVGSAYTRNQFACVSSSICGNKRKLEKIMDEKNLDFIVRSRFNLFTPVEAPEITLLVNPYVRELEPAPWQSGSPPAPVTQTAPQPGRPVRHGWRVIDGDKSEMSPSGTR